MDPKESKDTDQGELKARPKLVRITAISLAPPGHYRGGHYWQSGKPTYADVTEAQAAQIRKDKRLQILEGDIKNALPEAAVLKAIAEGNSEDRILREAERILANRKNREHSDGIIRRKFEVGR